MFALRLSIWATIAVQLCTSDLDAEWNRFKLQYSKSYKDPTEEAYRRDLFSKSLHFIDQHNVKSSRSEDGSYELGINQFSDMTDEEFRHSYLTLNDDVNDPMIFNVTSSIDTNSTVPDSINWVEAGYLNPVLNQGKCGSCYVFGALGAIEAHHSIKARQFVQLSHQEVMDCSKMLANNGCRGGRTSRAMYYVLENGVGFADDNPYEASERECEKTTPRYGIKGVFGIEQGNEQHMKEVVGTMGPVAFGFDASRQSFRGYKSGIYYEPECSEKLMAHAMVAVGYGSENGIDYWLVRNSWGPDWGENGHIRVSRNRNNNCGIATRAFYPVL